ncbi:hypothetical protein IW261DRAFT_1416512 [Armillaria novae-zelandiae]|uniref:Uncharacterized protein n=1 Tax=Armillaria novae-zelandiae TaxID=153914 RepID=A0AA39PHV1_9AGAR|nr:hypothetical protein IW261DRAFT_1416512 [Armillaria novae-zelandiae]
MSRRYNLRGQRGENVPQTEEGPTPPTTPILGSSPVLSPLTHLSDSASVVRETDTTPPVPYSHAVSPPATIKVEESGASSPVVSPSSTNHGGSDVFSSSPIGEASAFSLAGNGSDVPPSVIFGSTDMVMEKDDNPNPWIQVTRKSRRTHSLDKSSNNGNTTDSTVTRVRKEMNTGKGHEMGEQDTPLRAAETLLTLSQQELLRRWAKNVRMDKNFEEDSFSTLGVEYLGDGISTGKGKAADPGNWGAVDLENDETDPDEQRRALAFWNSVKKGDAKSLQELYDMQSGFEREKSHQTNEALNEEVKPHPPFVEQVPVPAHKAKPWKVKLEEVHDQDEIEYLYKLTPPLPLGNGTRVRLATPAPSVKKEWRQSSVPLSDLMDRQIEEIMGGRPRKTFNGQAPPVTRREIPDRIINPADQIEPTSHLGQLG